MTAPDILAEIRRITSGEPLADRAGHRDRLAEGTFDILVVGGGATGCGIALDAVTRGLRVGLVERDDFASGTSSRSSKMIHGGFRYLQTGDVALVQESLRERTRLQHNAPHLVSLLPFMIPLFLKGGLINPKVSRALGAALWSYQFAGSWRIGRRHRRLDTDAVIAHMQALLPERIGGGYLFYDLRADDARLTLALAQSAASHGAAVLNHAECLAISEPRQGLRRVRIGTAEGEFEVGARMVVNATGIWAGQLRDRLAIDTRQRLVAAKGAHLVFPRALFGNDVAVSLPTPDKRTLSLVDAGAFAYVGSTDTASDGALDAPCVTEADIDYILAGINRHVRRPVTEADITGGWSGYRPLLADQSKARTADLSRRHTVSVDAEGFVSVTGGKLTTYRAMAEETVDVACAALGRPARCRTRRMRLYGGDGASDFREQGDRLARRYGSRAGLVETLLRLDPALARPLTPMADAVVAEAVWGLNAEMAGSLADVLMRRTRVGLYDGRALLRDLDPIAERIMAFTDWSDARRQSEADHLRRSLHRELGPLADERTTAPVA